MIETIVAYLARNVSPSEIASIVGCSESYISQVKTREEYPALMEEALHKIEKSKEEKDLDAKYTNLEKKLLHSVEEQMPFAEFGHLTKLMDTLIRRKQAANSQGTNSMIVNQDNRIQTVILNIPQAAIPEIHVNSRKEVIGIGDKSLNPMTAGGVRGIFAAIEEQKKQEDVKRTMMVIENDL